MFLTNQNTCHNTLDRSKGSFFAGEEECCWWLEEPDDEAAGDDHHDIGPTRSGSLIDQQRNTWWSIMVIMVMVHHHDIGTTSEWKLNWPTKIDLMVRCSIRTARSPTRANKVKLLQQVERAPCWKMSPIKTAQISKMVKMVGKSRIKTDKMDETEQTERAAWMAKAGTKWA